MADALAGPLACHLLERLNDDPTTLFSRLGTLRDRALAQRGRAAGTDP